GLSGAAQRIHYAAELGEKAVTRRLDQAPVMRSDLRIEHLFADRLESLESAPLVRPDQPRVAGHISGHDGGETTGLAHFSSPAARRRPDSQSSRCSAFRRKLRSDTTTGVIARSRVTISRASSSRPIWA